MTRKHRFSRSSHGLILAGAPLIAAAAAAAMLWASFARPASAHPSAGDVSMARDTASRSTAEGVYTLTQANRGRELFADTCQSCHTPTDHAGPPFRTKWFGRTLGELFGYLRREMPQTDPGSLSDEEYSLLIAYLLRINGMTAGDSALAADSVSLHRIRLDSLPGPRT